MPSSSYSRTFDFLVRCDEVREITDTSSNALPRCRNRQGPSRNANEPSDKKHRPLYSRGCGEGGASSSTGSASSSSSSRRIAKLGPDVRVVEPAVPAPTQYGLFSSGLHQVASWGQFNEQQGTNGFKSSRGFDW